MNVVCRENGIDFATGSTKDYRNGFFFALFVIFVAKHPSGRGSVVSGSEGWISPVGYRWVTLGNGNVLRSAMALLRFSPRLTHPATSLIRRQEIKVDQGCSKWLKVAQGILKHFFMRTVKISSARQAVALAAKLRQIDRFWVRQSLTLPRTATVLL